MGDRFPRNNDDCALSSSLVVCDYYYLLNCLRSIPADAREINFARKLRSLEQVNSYLRDMFDWERVPMKCVYEWLEPAPKIVDSRTADDKEVAEALKKLCESLRAVNHVVNYADHLSDRRLYSLLVHTVLTERMKYLPNAKSPVYWDFCGYTEDDEFTDENCDAMFEAVWLAYYADDEQRARWEEKNHAAAPEKLVPEHYREFTARRSYLACC